MYHRLSSRLSKYPCRRWYGETAGGSAEDRSPRTESSSGTVEQIVDARVPQAVEELANVFRVFSQDRIQERTVEQTIPATSTC